MDARESERLVRDQIAYYGARASEYDEWFHRIGRYDRGEELNARWFAAVTELRRAVIGIEGSSVLEIGCGTGLTTELLARPGRTLTALDASPEMLAEARKRMVGAAVRFVKADMYAWHPPGRFEAIVFTFVLSHVPSDRFESFWSALADRLAPGGRVFLADSLFTQASTAVDHVLEGPEVESVSRRLNDGREFRIVKVFHTPEGLTERLRALGWEAELRAVDDLLFFGTCRLGPS